MEKTSVYKQRAQKVLAWPWLPFAVFFAFMLVCHLTFVMVDGDEVNYARELNERGLWGLTVYQFYNWSSRVFIEALLAILSWLPKLVWRLVNPVVATVCAWCVAKLCGVDKDARMNWMVCGLFILYPWQYLSTAGWIATTLVFLWPAAAALCAMLPAAKVMRGETPKPLWCAVSLPLLLYAGNNEQIAVLYALLLCVLGGYLLVKKQRLHWVLPAQLLMCVANIVYALTIPGPKMRTAVETTQWFPAFGMRSFAMNADLGMTATLDSVLYRRDFLFAFLCLLLAWLVWKRYKNVLYRLLALWPLAVTLVLGVFQNTTLRLFPQLAFFTNALQGEGMLGLHNVNMLTAYIPLLLLYFTFAACIVNMYLALGHTPEALCGIALLFCGFLSRAMLGFSPTVWTSGIRTGFFFSLCTVAVCVMLYRQARKQKGVMKVIFLVLFCAVCTLQMYSIAEM